MQCPENLYSPVNKYETPHNDRASFTHCLLKTTFPNYLTALAITPPKVCKTLTNNIAPVHESSSSETKNGFKKIWGQQCFGQKDAMYYFMNMVTSPLCAYKDYYERC